MTPLSKYGTNYKPPAPSQPETSVTEYQMPTGVQFFDALGQQLAAFPPPARDEAELRKLAEVGIGPGMTPSQDSKLSSDTLKGLADAVAAGPAQIKKDTQKLFAEGFAKNNGYLLGGFGAVRHRLHAARGHLAGRAGRLRPASGDLRHELERSRQEGAVGSSATCFTCTAPPANEGWSLTVYNPRALSPNPLNRYAFSNSSPLTQNADGSIDFYLQSTEPTDPAQAATGCRRRAARASR